MRNWRALSLVAVLIAAAFVWHMLPQAAKAQEVKLPPGVTLKTKEFDTGKMPGVKKVTWNRLEIKQGAKWANVPMEAKTWDFCYELSGTMTVTGPDGKTNNVPPGTAFTVPAGVTIPLLTNKGKAPAVDIFWEIELS